MPYLLLLLALLLIPSAHADRLLMLLKADVEALKETVELPKEFRELKELSCFYNISEEGAPLYYIHLRPHDLAEYLQDFANSALLKEENMLVGDDGVWLVDEGVELTKQQRMGLLIEKQKAPEGPLFMRIYVAESLETFDNLTKEADQRIKEAIDLLPKAVSQTLRQIESVEISVQKITDPLRMVAVVRAKEDTPLQKLLSQRLPKIDPGFLAQFPTTDACAYGYFRHNIAALVKFREQLQQQLASDSDTASDLLLSVPAKQLRMSDGINVLWVDSKLNPFTVSMGRWTIDTTNLLLKQQALQAQKLQGVFMESESAFIVGDAPVWKIKTNGQESSLVGLRNGDLYTSAAPMEDFTTFMELTAQPAEANLDTQFNHYPTVCAQVIAHPQRLYDSFVQQYPFFAFAKDNKFGDRNIYIAASLHRGALGITLDLPTQSLSVFSRNLVEKVMGLMQR